jgi:hypothetical protein
MLLRKVLAGSATDLSSRFRAAMVAMALSESGAVLGLLLMLLSGQVLYGALLCGLSFAITCFHFPTRSWLAHGDDPQ